MPDKKLTDSEILKALPKVRYGGHGCKNCKYDNGKGEDRCGLKGCKIARYALDLINRLQAENKKFKDRQKPTGASGYKIENSKVVFFTNMLGGYREEKENLEEVVKTLNELLQEAYAKDEIAFALKCKTEELKTAKAEAYKECIEKAKNNILPMLTTATLEEKETICFRLNKLDNLLKELVGEDNATQ